MLATIAAAWIVIASPVMLTDVPVQRVQRLSKGINLSHWWAQASDYNLGRIESQMTKDDFVQIKESGFNHVRLTLSWSALGSAIPTSLDREKVRLLQTDIHEIEDAGLAVIVDVHPDDRLKGVLATDGQARTAFLGFWQSLAQELKDTDPEWTFIEPLNEPVVDKDVWLPLQGQAVEAIRAVLPEHTMIVSGAKWSGVDDFLAMTTYPDSNLVYNFHTYDPMPFTHQGAGWGPAYLRDLKGLQYPSSPSAVSSILPDLEGEAKDEAKRYGDERWNSDRIDRLVRRCAEWGKQHRVPVTCNEFGCYVKAPRASRMAYIADMRKALEANGIGWTMWDYAGDFRTFTGTPGNRTADLDMLKALGLR